MADASSDLTLPIAPTTCPLCGASNGCAIGDGRDPKACWCMTTVVPADLLDQLPPESRGKACICAACVEAWNTRGVLRCYIRQG